MRQRNTNKFIIRRQRRPNQRPKYWNRWPNKKNYEKIMCGRRRRRQNKNQLYIYIWNIINIIESHLKIKQQQQQRKIENEAKYII